ncbi:MAG: hypothetical protein KGL35_17860 [Bradyrhizobium sp.]|uniref:hypothetical protein n=1 Tax=Bradyrhizobium sp. TaxID=376 RepID=UPI001C299FF6|nr:hypothetical protein [Bradyrhizobium sp.]MBU6462580.1 hypothetical protein [Pseudomonadota bacterium]MDE2067201.1 hypothetical protein [Bradyrhizobium sp.]MDE2470555.1 hypothetical protein [Bradyrhizobium sp.]
MNSVWFRIGTLVISAIGIAGCILGARTDWSAFAQAWLCSYIFWLGIPLAGITLVLVHDLSGGDWMATGRPVLDAAIGTMPLASLAGIPAFVRLASLYSWVNPPPDLPNVFYLNPTAFFIRYGAYLVLWNLLAAFALWGPREGREPIQSGLSWISGIGLIVLAFSASFAAIDWILSLEPTFWSSIFSYAQAASWFNTGFATVLLTVAMWGWPSYERRPHMSDLARILLAMTIFWAYVEFMQILIIWEENLKTEIPWYLKRLDPAWHPAIYLSAGLGFVVPFFVLLWAPAKRRRGVVAAVCVSILISRIAHTWLLLMPEFARPTPFWLDVAALFALGGLIMLLFGYGLRRARRFEPTGSPLWTADHG